MNIITKKLWFKFITVLLIQAFLFTNSNFSLAADFRYLQGQRDLLDELTKNTPRVKTEQIDITQTAYSPLNTLSLPQAGSESKIARDYAAGIGSNLSFIKESIKGMGAAGYDLTTMITLLKKSGNSARDVAITALKQGYFADEIYEALVSAGYSEHEAESLISRPVREQTREDREKLSLLQEEAAKREIIEQHRDKVLPEIGKVGVKPEQNIEEQKQQEAFVMMHALIKLDYRQEALVLKMFQQGYTDSEIITSFAQMGKGLVEIAALLKSANRSATDIIAAIKEAKLPFSNYQIYRTLLNADYSDQEIILALKSLMVSAEDVLKIATQLDRSMVTIAQAMISAKYSASEIVSSFISKAVNWAKDAVINIINCAVNALAALLNIQGKDTDKQRLAYELILQDILAEGEVVIRGQDVFTSMYALKMIATKYQVNLDGYEMDLESLIKTNRPVIIHFEGHWVTLIRIDSNNVTIIDNGEKKILTTKEFNRLWDGKVLSDQAKGNSRKLTQQEMQITAGANAGEDAWDYAKQQGLSDEEAGYVARAAALDEIERGGGHLYDDDDSNDNGGGSATIPVADTAGYAGDQAWDATMRQLINQGMDPNSQQAQDIARAAAKGAFMNAAQNGAYISPYDAVNDTAQLAAIASGSFVPRETVRAVVAAQINTNVNQGQNLQRAIATVQQNLNDTTYRNTLISNINLVNNIILSLPVNLQTDFRNAPLTIQQNGNVMFHVNNNNTNPNLLQSTIINPSGQITATVYRNRATNQWEKMITPTQTWIYDHSDPAVIKIDVYYGDSNTLPISMTEYQDAQTERTIKRVDHEKGTTSVFDWSQEGVVAINVFRGDEVTGRCIIVDVRDANDINRRLKLIDHEQGTISTFDYSNPEFIVMNVTGAKWMTYHLDPEDGMAFYAKDHKSGADIYFNKDGSGRQVLNGVTVYFDTKGKMIGGDTTGNEVDPEQVAKNKAKWAAAMAEHSGQTTGDTTWGTGIDDPSLPGATDNASDTGTTDANTAPQTSWWDNFLNGAASAANNFLNLFNNPQQPPSPQENIFVWDNLNKEAQSPLALPNIDLTQVTLDPLLDGARNFVDLFNVPVASEDTLAWSPEEPSFLDIGAMLFAPLTETTIDTDTWDLGYISEDDSIGYIPVTMSAAQVDIPGWEGLKNLFMGPSSLTYELDNMGYIPLLDDETLNNSYFTAGKSSEAPANQSKLSLDEQVSFIHTLNGVTGVVGGIMAQLPQIFGPTNPQTAAPIDPNTGMPAVQNAYLQQTKPPNLPELTIPGLNNLMNFFNQKKEEITNRYDIIQTEDGRVEIKGLDTNDPLVNILYGLRQKLEPLTSNLFTNFPLLQQEQNRISDLQTKLYPTAAEDGPGALELVCGLGPIGEALHNLGLALPKPVKDLMELANEATDNLWKLAIGSGTEDLAREAYEKPQGIAQAWYNLTESAQKVLEGASAAITDAWDKVWGFAEEEGGRDIAELWKDAREKIPVVAGTIDENTGRYITQGEKAGAYAPELDDLTSPDTFLLINIELRGEVEERYKAAIANGDTRNSTTYKKALDELDTLDPTQGIIVLKKAECGDAPAQPGSFWVMHIDIESPLISYDVQKIKFNANSALSYMGLLDETTPEIFSRGRLAELLDAARPAIEVLREECQTRKMIKENMPKTYQSIEELMKQEQNYADVLAQYKDDPTVRALIQEQDDAHFADVNLAKASLETYEALFDVRKINGQVQDAIATYWNSDENKYNNAAVDNYMNKSKQYNDKVNELKTNYGNTYAVWQDLQHARTMYDVRLNLYIDNPGFDLSSEELVRFTPEQLQARSQVVIDYKSARDAYSNKMQELYTNNPTLYNFIQDIQLLADIGAILQAGIEKRIRESAVGTNDTGDYFGGVGEKASLNQQKDRVYVELLQQLAKQGIDIDKFVGMNESDVYIDPRINSDGDNPVAYISSPGEVTPAHVDRVRDISPAAILEKIKDPDARNTAAMIINSNGYAQRIQTLDQNIVLAKARMDFAMTRMQLTHNPMSFVIPLVLPNKGDVLDFRGYSVLDWVDLTTTVPLLFVGGGLLKGGTLLAKGGTLLAKGGTKLTGKFSLAARFAEKLEPIATKIAPVASRVGAASSMGVTAVAAANAASFVVNNRQFLSFEQNIAIFATTTLSVLGLSGANVLLTQTASQGLKGIGLHSLRAGLNLGTVFGNVDMLVNNVLAQQMFSQGEDKGFLGALELSAKSYFGWDYETDDQGRINKDAGFHFDPLNVHTYTKGFIGGFILGGLLGVFGGVANVSQAATAAMSAANPAVSQVRLARVYHLGTTAYQGISNSTRLSRVYRLGESAYKGIYSGTLNSRVIGGLTVASLGGFGNIAWSYLTGGLNASSTPGEFVAAFAKGAFLGILFKWAISPQGMEFVKGIGGHVRDYSRVETAELQTGLLRRSKTPFTGDGINQLALDALEGAIKWPFVSMVMNMASPVWDTGIHVLETGADRIVGRFTGNQELINSSWQFKIGDEYTWFREGTEEQGYLPLDWGSFFTANRAISWFAAAKEGKFMGPMIKVMMRHSDEILSKSPQALTRAKAGEGAYNKARAFIGRPMARIEGSLARGMAANNSFLSIASGLVLEAKSLTFVSGFVTGIERGLQSVRRAGAYADVVSGALTAADIQAAGGFEQALARYSGMAFSEGERFALGWALLFMKPNLNRLNAELLTVREADGKINSEKTVKNFATVRKYGSLREALRQGADLEMQVLERVGELVPVVADYLREQGFVEQQTDMITQHFSRGNLATVGRDIRLGLEYLSEYAADGKKDNLQKFLAHSIWLAEGKPEGRSDIHWELAGKALAGDSSNAEIIFRNSLRRESLGVENSFGAELIKGVNSLNLSELGNLIRAHNEIKPLSDTLREKLGKEVQLVGDQDARRLLDKDVQIGDQVLVEVKLPSGERAPLRVELTEALRMQASMQVFEPYRLEGNITEGLMEVYRINPKDTKYVRHLVDYVQEHRYNARGLEKRLSAEGAETLTQTQRDYYQKQQEYQQAYLKGETQQQLALRQQSISQSLDRVNLEILKDINALIGENPQGFSEATIIGGQALLERNIKQGLTSEKLSTRNISTYIIDAYIRQLDRVADAEISNLIDRVKTARQELEHSPLIREKNELLNKIDNLRDKRRQLAERRDSLENGTGIEAFDNSVRLIDKQIERLNQGINELNKQIDRRVEGILGKQEIQLIAGSARMNMGVEMLIKLYPELEIVSGMRKMGKEIEAVVQGLESGEIEVFVDKETGKVQLQGAEGEIITEFNRDILVEGKISKDAVQERVREITGRGEKMVEGLTGLVLRIVFEKAHADLIEAKKLELKKQGRDVTKEELTGLLDVERSTAQIKMVVELLKENSVYQAVGGGKTLGFIMEMLVRGEIAKALGKSLNQLLVVKTGEAEQTVLAGDKAHGGKGSIKLQELVDIFGYELKDGNKYYTERNEQGLVDVLLSPDKIVVVDQTRLGFLSLSKNQRLCDALAMQDVVRFDEFHIPFSSKVTYITSETSLLLEKEFIEAAFHAKKALDTIFQKEIGVPEKGKIGRAQDIAEARKEEHAYVYRDRGEYCLNGKALEIINSHNIKERTAKAYFDARFAEKQETYDVKDKEIKPVENGNIAEDRVFSDRYFIAALYAKESANGPDIVDRNKLFYSKSSSQSTVAEVLGMFGRQASVLGASGTLETVELMHMLHLGKGVAKITPSTYKDVVTRGFASEPAIIRNIIREIVSSRRNGRGVLILVKDPVMYELVRKFLNDNLGETIELINTSASEKKVGDLANDAQNRIILSNVKGATGIDYIGVVDLVIADGHNWTRSELYQGIGRNRRNVAEGLRRVFYLKGALREKTASGVRLQELKRMQVTYGREVKDQAKELIRNAELMQSEELSAALVHHIREAAYSRGVIEPVKHMMRLATSEQKRDSLEAELRAILDKKDTAEVNLRLSHHARNAEEIIEQTIRGVASSSRELFDLIAKGDYGKAVKSRAALLRDIAESILTSEGYQKIQARRDISFREAVNIREITAVAKHRRFLDRILSEEISHANDVSQNRTVVHVIQQIDQARRKGGEARLTLAEKAKLFKNFDRIVLSNGTRGSPELLSRVAVFLPNDSPVTQVLEDLALQGVSLNTPQQAQTILDFISENIINSSAFADYDTQDKEEVIDFVLGMLNPEVSYDNLIIAATVYNFLTDEAKQEVEESSLLSQTFLSQPEEIAAAMLKPKVYKAPIESWQKRRQVKKDGFALSRVQQFAFTNTLGLSKKAVEQSGQRMSFVEFEARAEALLTQQNPAIATSANVEALAYTLLKLEAAGRQQEGAGLSWAGFKTARTQSAQVAVLGMEDNLRGHRLFAADKQNERAKLNAKRAELNAEIASAWKSGDFQRAIMLSQQIRNKGEKSWLDEVWDKIKGSFVRKLGTDILSLALPLGSLAIILGLVSMPISIPIISSIFSAGSSLPFPMLALSLLSTPLSFGWQAKKMYKYYVQGEAAISVDTLLNQTSKNLGVLPVLNELNLPEEYASRIEALITKQNAAAESKAGPEDNDGETENEPLTLADLGNDQIAQTIARLINPASPSIERLKVRDEQLAGFADFIEQSNLDQVSGTGKDSLKEQLKNRITEARQLPNLLISEHQFENLINELNQYTHQAALDSLDQVVADAKGRIKQYKKDVQEHNDSPQQRQELLGDLLTALVNNQMITEQEKNAFINNPDQKNLAIKPEYKKVHNLLIELSQQPDPAAYLEKIANADDAEAEQMLNLLVELGLRPQGINFDKRVLRVLIADLKEAMQKADQQLEKILNSGLRDPYIKKYARAMRNSTLAHFANNAFDENDQKQENPYQVRLNTLTGYASLTVDELRRDLEQDPEREIIVMTIRNGRVVRSKKERVFKDLEAWLNWRIEGLAQTLSDSDLTVQGRDWVEAEQEFYQAGRERLQEIGVEQPILDQSFNQAREEATAFKNEITNLVEGLIKQHFSMLSDGLKGQLKGEILKALRTVTLSGENSRKARKSDQAALAASINEVREAFESRADRPAGIGLARSFNEVSNSIVENLAGVRAYQDSQQKLTPLQTKRAVIGTEKIKLEREIISAAKNPEKSAIKNIARFNFFKRVFEMPEAGISTLVQRECVLQRFGMTPNRKKSAMTADMQAYKPSMQQLSRAEFLSRVLSGEDRKWIEGLSDEQFLDRVLKFADKFWAGELEIGSVGFATFKGENIVSIGNRTLEIRAQDAEIQPIKEALAAIEPQALAGINIIVVDSSLGELPFQVKGNTLSLNPQYLPLVTGVINSAINKQGVRQQAYELLPYLLSEDATGVLAETRLGGIAVGLNSSLRLEKRAAVQSLVDLIYQVNGTTPGRLTRFNIQIDVLRIYRNLSSIEPAELSKINPVEIPSLVEEPGQAVQSQVVQAQTEEPQAVQPQAEQPLTETVLASESVEEITPEQERAILPAVPLAVYIIRAHTGGMRSLTTKRLKQEGILEPEVVNLIAENPAVFSRLKQLAAIELAKQTIVSHAVELVGQGQEFGDAITAAIKASRKNIRDMVNGDQKLGETIAERVLEAVVTLDRRDIAIATAIQAALPQATKIIYAQGKVEHIGIAQLAEHGVMGNILDIIAENKTEALPRLRQAAVIELAKQEIVVFAAGFVRQAGDIQTALDIAVAVARGERRINKAIAEIITTDAYVNKQVVFAIAVNAVANELLRTGIPLTPESVEQIINANVEIKGVLFHNTQKQDTVAEIIQAAALHVALVMVVPVLAEKLAKYIKAETSDRAINEALSEAVGLAQYQEHPIAQQLPELFKNPELRRKVLVAAAVEVALPQAEYILYTEGELAAINLGCLDKNVFGNLVVKIIAENQAEALPELRKKAAIELVKQELLSQVGEIIRLTMQGKDIKTAVDRVITAAVKAERLGLQIKKFITIPNVRQTIIFESALLVAAELLLPLGRQLSDQQIIAILHQRAEEISAILFNNQPRAQVIARIKQATVELAIEKVTAEVAPVLAKRLRQGITAKEIDLEISTILRSAVYKQRVSNQAATLVEAVDSAKKELQTAAVVQAVLSPAAAIIYRTGNPRAVNIQQLRKQGVKDDILRIIAENRAEILPRLRAEANIEIAKQIIITQAIELAGQDNRIKRAVTQVIAVNGEKIPNRVRQDRAIKEEMLFEIAITVAAREILDQKHRHSLQFSGRQNVNVAKILEQANLSAVAEILFSSQREPQAVVDAEQRVFEAVAIGLLTEVCQAEILAELGAGTPWQDIDLVKVARGTLGYGLNPRLSAALENIEVKRQVVIAATVEIALPEFMGRKGVLEFEVLNNKLNEAGWHETVIDQIQGISVITKLAQAVQLRAVQSAETSLAQAAEPTKPQPTVVEQVKAAAPVTQEQDPALLAQIEQVMPLLIANLAEVMEQKGISISDALDNAVTSLPEQDQAVAGSIIHHADYQEQRNQVISSAVLLLAQETIVPALAKQLSNVNNVIEIHSVLMKLVNDTNLSPEVQQAIQANFDQIIVCAAIEVAALVYTDYIIKGGEKTLVNNALLVEAGCGTLPEVLYLDKNADQRQQIQNKAMVKVAGKLIAPLMVVIMLEGEDIETAIKKAVNTSQLSDMVKDIILTLEQQPEVWSEIITHIAIRLSAEIAGPEIINQLAQGKNPEDIDLGQIAAVLRNREIKITHNVSNVFKRSEVKPAIAVVTAVNMAAEMLISSENRASWKDVDDIDEQIVTNALAAAGLRNLAANVLFAEDPIVSKEEAIAMIQEKAALNLAISAAVPVAVEMMKKDNSVNIHSLDAELSQSGISSAVRDKINAFEQIKNQAALQIAREAVVGKVAAMLHRGQSIDAQAVQTIANQAKLPEQVKNVLMRAIVLHELKTQAAIQVAVLVAVEMMEAGQIVNHDKLNEKLHNTGIAPDVIDTINSEAVFEQIPEQAVLQLSQPIIDAMGDIAINTIDQAVESVITAIQTKVPQISNIIRERPQLKQNLRAAVAIKAAAAYVADQMMKVEHDKKINIAALLQEVLAPDVIKVITNNSAFAEIEKQAVLRIAGQTVIPALTAELKEATGIVAVHRRFMEETEKIPSSQAREVMQKMPEKIISRAVIQAAVEIAVPVLQQVIEPGEELKIKFSQVLAAIGDNTIVWLIDPNNRDEVLSGIKAALVTAAQESRTPKLAIQWPLIVEALRNAAEGFELVPVGGRDTGHKPRMGFTPPQAQFIDPAEQPDDPKGTVEDRFTKGVVTGHGENLIVYLLAAHVSADLLDEGVTPLEQVQLLIKYSMSGNTLYAINKFFKDNNIYNPENRQDIVTSVEGELQRRIESVTVLLPQAVAILRGDKKITVTALERKAEQGKISNAAVEMVKANETTLLPQLTKAAVLELGKEVSLPGIVDQLRRGVEIAKLEVETVITQAFQAMGVTMSPEMRGIISMYDMLDCVITAAAVQLALPNAINRIKKGNEVTQDTFYEAGVSSKLISLIQERAPAVVDSLIAAAAIQFTAAAVGSEIITTLEQNTKPENINIKEALKASGVNVSAQLETVLSRREVKQAIILQAAVEATVKAGMPIAIKVAVALKGNDLVAMRAEAKQAGISGVVINILSQNQAAALPKLENGIKTAIENANRPQVAEFKEGEFNLLKQEGVHVYVPHAQLIGASSDTILSNNVNTLINNLKGRGIQDVDIILVDTKPGQLETAQDAVIVSIVDNRTTVHLNMGSMFTSNDGCKIQLLAGLISDGINQMKKTQPIADEFTYKQIMQMLNKNGGVIKVMVAQERILNEEGARTEELGTMPLLIIIGYELATDEKRPENWNKGGSMPIDTQPKGIYGGAGLPQGYGITDFYLLIDGSL
ncbi:MAG: cysteine peptidase family C39 domain-containing protein [Candidatus Omnitrophota bacterium]